MQAKSVDNKFHLCQKNFNFVDAIFFKKWYPLCKEIIAYKKTSFNKQKTTFKYFECTLIE